MPPVSSCHSPDLIPILGSCHLRSQRLRQEDLSQASLRSMMRPYLKKTKPNKQKQLKKKKPRQLQLLFQAEAWGPWEGTQSTGSLLGQEAESDSWKGLLCFDFLFSVFSLNVGLRYLKNKTFFFFFLNQKVC